MLAGVALLLAFRALPPLGSQTGAAHPALWVLLFWGVLFDGTHVFATYARSYLAPPSDEASRRALPGWWSLGIVLVGPAAAIADHLWFTAAPSVVGHAGLLYRWFLLAAYLWAYWHLVRQHYGFLALYNRKAGAPRGAARLDTAILWAGCLYPYLRFSLGPAFAASGLPVLLPAGAAAALRPALDAVAVAAAIAMVAAAIARRVRPAPKHLLLAIVIGFHAATFALLDNLLEITATLTIFHNLQYHRIVWQHERGRNRVPAGGLVRYLVLGAAFGVAWYLPRVLGAATAPSDLAANLLLGIGWGIAFHHYLVDSRIWRVRRTPAVARALDAGAGATGAGTTARPGAAAAGREPGAGAGAGAGAAA